MLLMLPLLLLAIGERAGENIEFLIEHFSHWLEYKMRINNHTENASRKIYS